MKHFYLCLTMLVAGVLAVSAQVPVNNTLATVGVTSPDAASLGKFGNIPVSYSAGIPSITIPVYEIKIGKLSVPISLDYHASGIKVDEIPSSVGTGWALNCGGMVSRNMMGLPDDATGGYLTSPTAAELQEPTPLEYDGFFISVYQHAAETQPDL